MKIEEMNSEEIDNSVNPTGKPNVVAKHASKSSLMEIKRGSVENNICICEKGPGPSHSNKPLPHMKGTYCVRNDNKKVLSNCGDIARGLMKMHLSSSSTKSGRSREDSSDLLSKKTIPTTNRDKSIFTCKSKADRSVGSTGIIIEEIPKESKEKNVKSNTKSKTNRTHSKKSDIRLENEIKNNRNLIEARKLNYMPKKIEVASKYRQPCRKENVVTNFENIKNRYEFIRAWQSLKDDNDLQPHARLLRALASEDLDTGNQLDGAMFSLILRCLERHFCTSQDCELIVRYLKSLSQLSRFSIVKMFMDNNDKKALANVFRFLEEQGSKEVSILREVYV